MEKTDTASPVTVTVTTTNDRNRTYRFKSNEEAVSWIRLLANIDPKTAKTATVQ